MDNTADVDERFTWRQRSVIYLFREIKKVWDELRREGRTDGTDAAARVVCDEHEEKVLTEGCRFADLGKVKPTVIFAGFVNSGKSSLINEFLGGNYLPMNSQPCTGRIVRVSFSADTPYYQLCSAPGVAIPDSRSDVDINSKWLRHRKEGQSAVPDGLVNLQGRSRANDQEVGRIIDVHLNNDFLESGIEIIDTPGISENRVLDKVVLDTIVRDALWPTLVYVIDGINRLRLTDRDELEHFRKECRGLKIIFVVTKVDIDRTSVKLDCDIESDDEEELQQKINDKYCDLEKDIDKLKQTLKKDYHICKDTESEHEFTCVSVKEYRKHCRKDSTTLSERERKQVEHVPLAAKNVKVAAFEHFSDMMIENQEIIDSVVQRCSDLVQRAKLTELRRTEIRNTSKSCEERLYDSLGRLLSYKTVETNIEGAFVTALSRCDRYIHIDTGSVAWEFLDQSDVNECTAWLKTFINETHKQQVAKANAYLLMFEIIFRVLRDETVNYFSSRIANCSGIPDGTFSCDAVICNLFAKSYGKIIGNNRLNILINECLTLNMECLKAFAKSLIRCEELGAKLKGVKVYGKYELHCMKSDVRKIIQELVCARLRDLAENISKSNLNVLEKTREKFLEEVDRTCSGVVGKTPFPGNVNNIDADHLISLEHFSRSAINHLSFGTVTLGAEVHKACRGMTVHSVTVDHAQRKMMAFKLLNEDRKTWRSKMEELKLATRMFPVKHENVLEIISFFMPSINELYVFTEPCQGRLNDFLTNNRSNLTRTQKLNLALGVTQGINAISNTGCKFGGCSTSDIWLKSTEDVSSRDVVVFRISTTIADESVMSANRILWEIFINDDHRNILSSVKRPKYVDRDIWNVIIKECRPINKIVSIIKDLIINDKKFKIGEPKNLIV